MAEITRSLKISPSTVSSVSSYKIDVEEVTEYDSLVVNIEHEKEANCMTLQFKGKDIAPYKSLRILIVMLREAYNVVPIVCHYCGTCTSSFVPPDIH